MAPSPPLIDPATHRRARALRPPLSSCSCVGAPSMNHNKHQCLLWPYVAGGRAFQICHNHSSMCIATNYCDTAHSLVNVAISVPRPAGRTHSCSEATTWPHAACHNGPHCVLQPSAFSSSPRAVPPHSPTLKASPSHKWQPPPPPCRLNGDRWRPATEGVASYASG